MPNGRKRKVVDNLNEDLTYRDISVKCKLGRLKPSPDVRAAIEDITLRVHDIVARGLLLANHTVIQDLNYGRIPNIINQSWWLNCMKVWGSLEISRGPRASIDPSVASAYESLRSKPGMTQVPMEYVVHTLNQCVEILMSNTFTHIAQTFHSLLKRAFQREIAMFEKDHRKLDQTERRNALRCGISLCIGDDINWEGVQDDIINHLQDNLFHWKTKYHNILPLPNAQSIKKDNIPFLLEWIHALASHREKCILREDVNFPRGTMKSHRLIPLGTLKIRHILITKTVFKEEILPLARKLRGSTDANILEPNFEDFFPGIQKLRPSKDSVFAGFLATDGVSVSLRFMKPVSIEGENIFKRYKKFKGFVTVEGQDMKSRHVPSLPQKNQRLVALDPGRRDIVFGSVLGSSETLRMSTGQLCHDSGRKWSQRFSEKAFHDIKIGDVSLSDAKANLPSSKVSSLEEWELFLHSYIPILQPTLNVWKRKIFRKTALWCYSKRDKCLDTLCKRITGGVKGTLVAFGGASSCSTGCGYAPVPQKRLRTRLEKIHGARVSIIDEFYTSQRCSLCKNWLSSFSTKKGECWALKKCTHCKSAKGTDLIWNRDRNASLNIMQIYLHLAEQGERPKEFSRTYEL